MLSRYSSRLIVAHLDLASKLFLLGKLNILPLGLELLVISMLAQALQQVSLCDPLVAAKGLSDEACQLRVAVGQPPAGSHAIGLVLKLLWCQVIEVLHIVSKDATQMQQDADFCESKQLAKARDQLYGQMQWM